MKIRLWILVAIACGVGCSVPDGDDMRRLTSSISGWSDSAKQRVIRYAMSRRAIEWLQMKPGKDAAGWVHCRRGSDNEEIDIDVITADDVLKCLLLDSSKSYIDCTVGLLDAKAREYNGSKKAEYEEKLGDSIYGCYGEVERFYDKDHVDELMVDPDAWSDDEIARAVIAIPGPLPGGPIPGMLPFLCPLAEDPDSWGCPGSPEYPPGETPEPGDEGDR
jgi:hypothetical protein